MMRRFKKTGALIGLLLLVCSHIFAQGNWQTLERQELDLALAVEEPAARITSLQRFLKAHPNSDYAVTASEEIVRAWALLAEGELSEKNIDRALLYFRRALVAIPHRVSDRFFEETVARIPLAVSVRGYRTEAIALARELESHFSTEPQRLGTLGEFYLSIEAASDAVRALELAAQLAPDEALLHRTLGTAYRQGLRLDDAAAEFQQAIGLNPREKQSYYELANLYRAQGAYEEAAKLYHKQLEIEPKHTSSLKGLALTYLAQGKDVLAGAELNRLRDLKGSAEEINQDLYLQTQLAFYYLVRGKSNQAQKAAELALTLEPRYSWARIAAAEVDLAEGRYFEAERHLLAALRYANFPTLYFTLGKVYLAVEDFDDALDQFAKAFSYTPSGEFKTRLGGVLEAHAQAVGALLARERQAAILVFDPPPPEAQFKLVEALVRLDASLRKLRPSTSERAEAARDEPSGAAAEAPVNVADVEKAAMEFIEAEGFRRPFRMLYIAQRLAQTGQVLELAVKLAEQALDLAEVATEADASLRDYPNYDREGRLRIFRGRAADTLGWALLKLGRNKEAISALDLALAAYGELPERKRALWHLAVAKETAGELSEALDLYIAGYEPPSAASRASDINRTIIEALYRKVHGSLEGLDQRMGRALSTSGGELLAASSLSDSGPSSSAEPGVNLSKTPKEVRRGSGPRNSSVDVASGKPRSAIDRSPTVPIDQLSPSLPSANREPHSSPRSSVKRAAISQIKLPTIKGDKDFSLLLVDPGGAFLSPDKLINPPSEELIQLETEERVMAVRRETPPPDPSATATTISTRPRRVFLSDRTLEPQVHTRKRRVKESNDRRRSKR